MSDNDNNTSPSLCAYLATPEGRSITEGQRKMLLSLSRALSEEGGRFFDDATFWPKMIGALRDPVAA
jgi:hypothetical protein